MDHRRPGVVGAHAPTRESRGQPAGRLPYAVARSRAKGGASPHPVQAARIAFRGKRDAAPAHGIKSSQVRPGPPAGYASLVPGEASVGRSLRALWDGRQASSAARCRTIENDTGVGVMPRRPRENRCRRRRARRRQLGRSGCRGLSPAVIPVGEIQETTPGERIGFSAIPRTLWARPR